MSEYKIITDRDKKILDLVEELKVVDVFVVDTMLFKNTKSTRVAQRRLLNLVECNKLKRWRMNQISNYIYYKNRKPKNIEHSLLMSYFIAHLSLLGADIKKVKREWLIAEGIRVDLFVAYILNNKNYISIVEVENTKSFQSKYDKLEAYFSSNEYKNLFPTIPSVICISDKPYKKGVLDVIDIDTNFSNIDILLK